MKFLRRHLPILIVGLVVAIIIGLRVLAIALPEPMGPIDARVVLPENQVEKIAAKQKLQQLQGYLAASDGEVSRTEQRIRETLALAMASSLFAGYQLSKRETPATVNDLLLGTRNSGLLPPGLQLLSTEGAVSSARGVFYVRYRLEPLAVEVVSVGKERMDGPALLVRVPDHFNEDGARIYQATRLDEITVPPPFAHEAQVISLGFVPQSLRAVLQKPN
jgi:hypothetical protein